MVGDPWQVHAWRVIAPGSKAHQPANSHPQDELQLRDHWLVQIIGNPSSVAGAPATMARRARRYLAARHLDTLPGEPQVVPQPGRTRTATGPCRPVSREDDARGARPSAQRLPPSLSPQRIYRSAPLRRPPRHGSPGSRPPEWSRPAGLQPRYRTLVVRFVAGLPLPTPPQLSSCAPAVLTSVLPSTAPIAVCCHRLAPPCRNLRQNPRPEPHPSEVVMAVLSRDRASHDCCSAASQASGRAIASCGGVRPTRPAPAASKSAARLAKRGPGWLLRRSDPPYRR